MLVPFLYTDQNAPKSDDTDKSTKLRVSELNLRLGALHQFVLSRVNKVFLCFGKKKIGQGKI